MSDEKQFVPTGLLTLERANYLARKALFADTLLAKVDYDVGKALASIEEDWKARRPPEEELATQELSEAEIAVARLDKQFADTMRDIASQLREHTWSAHRWIRNAAYTETLRTFIFTSHGELIQMPHSIWGGEEFGGIVSSGRASTVHRSELVSGRVLVRAEDLERALPDQPQGSTTTSSRLPPYLKFMVRAAEALRTSADERLPKDKIRQWLRDNWPSELGELSDNKIESMATFLRRPEHQKGGLLSGQQVRDLRRG
jgi:hypothetical protein